MTKIYLIRHTQAEGNLYRMMQGHWDGDVTELGFRQVDALAERFADIPVDAVYSSDLYRTRVTASAITRTHALPINTDKRLREINMGPWETQFFGNVHYSLPQETEYFIHDPLKWQVDGAETFEQVGKRAYPALTEIAQKHPNQSVAVVSHGVTIRCLLSKITGISLDKTEKIPICKNTAVSTLTYENGVFTAESINDYSHIIPLAQPDWKMNADLRDECFDPQSDPEYYHRCYADAWSAAHGSLNGYRPEPYLKSAVEHYKRDNHAVLRVYNGEEDVGLIDLDTARGADKNYGWISLLYLKPEYRGKGYGIQLLARAIKYYREQGRAALRLHMAEDNKTAAEFYRRQGFAVLSGEKNALGTLYLMEKKLEGGRADV